MEVEELPELDRPNLIAAFQGWNDAGQGASTAVRYLVETWKARRFAHIDPEEYFSFSDTRPRIKIVEGDERELTWPSNEFFAFEGKGNSASAVLMIGTEPNLRWRSFCGEVMRLASSVGAQRLVTLGSLVTDAVHTRPVPLTGFSTDPSVQIKLAARNIRRSSYEGPTGIVGVLHDACRRAELPAASIWAASPYYLGATPNPKTSLGLLEALDDALGLGANLRRMQIIAEEFGRQVSQAVLDNEEMQQQIRSLEERFDAASETAGQQPQAELPPAGALIADLEDFLREQQRGDGQPGS